jgi:hypothetical protein
MTLRILRWLQRKIDKAIERRVLKTWRGTGADGRCDPSCSHCGCLCPSCGRP